MANFDKIAKIHDFFLFQSFSSAVFKWCVPFLRDFLKNNYKVLDIGCATGIFFNTLKKENNSLELFGLDESGEMISRAKKKFEDINLIVGQAEKLPFENDYFNLIVILGSFHYFQNQKEAFLECYRVLKNGGHIVITLPQCDNSWQKFRTNIIERNFYKIFPGDVKRNCQFVSFDDLLLLGKESKFYLIKTAVKSFEVGGIKTRLVIFEKYL